jgi:nitroreductase
MNDTLKTIAKRYSCRAFTDKAISNSNLDAIAEAGIQAPSGINRQNWQIIIVKDRALLSEMETEGMQVMMSFQIKPFITA